MKCPYCESGVMEEWSREKTVRYQEQVIQVMGYRSWVCHTCGEEVITKEQSKDNRDLMIASAGLVIDPTKPMPL